MAISNNCGNCRKQTSCRLCHDIEAILEPYSNWFSDPDEACREIKEAIGKECTKFVENGG
jgi:hypothetical protein